jgi:conjugative transfer region lipoprotein (TIGR03751 family)
MRFATALWTSLVLGVSGCAGTKETTLPQDGPSMQAIYDAHFEGLAEDTHGLRSAVATRPLASGEADLAGFSRSAHTELETVFPRLPNPTLVLYVFPHLAGSEGLPVPGYATTFTLYERVHYALPGEVPGLDH